jgi:hypothetical protein
LEDFMQVEVSLEICQKNEDVKALSVFSWDLGTDFLG